MRNLNLHFLNQALSTMWRVLEVMAALGGRLVLNLHLKEAGERGALVAQVADLLRAETMLDRAYIAGDADVLQTARDIVPELPRCSLVRDDCPNLQVRAAIELGCERVQFGRHVTDEDIRAARDAGMVCNLFWSDEPEDARAYAARGIDVILTNAVHRMVGGL